MTNLQHKKSLWTELFPVYVFIDHEKNLVSESKDIHVQKAMESLGSVWLLHLNMVEIFSKLKCLLDTISGCHNNNWP